MEKWKGTEVGEQKLRGLLLEDKVVGRQQLPGSGHCTVCSVQCAVCSLHCTLQTVSGQRHRLGSARATSADWKLEI